MLSRRACFPSQRCYTYLASLQKPLHVAAAQEDQGGFFELLEEGETGGDDISFYASSLQQCTDPKVLNEGRHVHALISEHGHDWDRYLCNLLVQMYGNCGTVDDAMAVFTEMHDRNRFSWGIMIGACIQCGHINEAFQLLQQMHTEGVIMDRVTFLNMLSACSSQEMLQYGMRVHSFIMFTKFAPDIALTTALVTMYGKCGSVRHAQKMFESMVTRNQVSWNAYLAVCAQNGWEKEALKLYQQMHVEGVMANEVTFVSTVDACASGAAVREGRQIHVSIISSVTESHLIVRNALINMYGKSGNIDSARRIFDATLNRSVSSWNAILTTYGKHGQGKEVVRLFEKMLQEGVKPDKVTYFSVLSACSHAALVHEGRSYFNAMIQDHGIVPTVEHYNCMIDLFGRAGMLDDGERLIKRMPFPPDRKSWMSILSACRMHLDVERGERIAEHVFDVFRDEGKFYVLLSNIYMEAGKFDAADQLRSSMRVKGIQCAAE